MLQFLFVRTDPRTSQLIVAGDLKQYDDTINTEKDLNVQTSFNE